MEAVTANQAETKTRATAPPPVGPHLKHVFQNAAKAFDLIHKYRTPPDPKTYAIWYAYADGTLQPITNLICVPLQDILILLV